MAATLLAFRGPGDACTACGRPTTTHRVAGRWVGCSRDVTIMQDQHTAARRLRLQMIRSRSVVKAVRPWGIEP